MTRTLSPQAFPHSVPILGQWALLAEFPLGGYRSGMKISTTLRCEKEFWYRKALLISHLYQGVYRRVGIKFQVLNCVEFSNHLKLLALTFFGFLFKFRIFIKIQKLYKTEHSKF